MANILYVHGYGSDKNSTTGKYLKQILSPFHNVITNTYDLCNFDRAQHQIMTDAKRYRCAVVIGSSTCVGNLLTNANTTESYVNKSKANEKLSANLSMMRKRLSKKNNTVSG